MQERHRCPLPEKFVAVLRIFRPSREREGKNQLRLGGRRGDVCILALGDTGGLAAAAAQVIELGAAHPGPLRTTVTLSTSGE